MEIIFTERAKFDLAELRVRLMPLSPAGLANVTAAIEACVLSLLTFPRSGRLTPREGVLETVELKYGFTIPYYIKNDTIYILRVYRSRRRPLDYSALDLS